LSSSLIKFRDEEFSVVTAGGFAGGVAAMNDVMSRAPQSKFLEL
jgi:hypothetical protein